MFRLCSALVVAVCLAARVHTAPAPLAQAAGSGEGQGRPDAPVEQLEKLKSVENKDDLNREHVDTHSADGAPTAEHSESEHGHHDVTTMPPSDEQTTKVFHGAARLVQAGAGAAGHTAARRSFNADITKETNNNMDHYSSYAGVQYSPLDMAEYVLWTGDERGVTAAVEEFLRRGQMSKEEAIAFLQEIKFNLEYLRAHFAPARDDAAQQQAQQERLRAMLMEQASKEYPFRPPASLQSFPFGGSPDIVRAISSKTWDLSNSLAPYSLPVTTDLRPEVKRSYDPMLQTNIISTSDYDRDGPVISEEQYEEMTDKMKAADNLYTEYTLEEIIYQLAKLMFSQSLSREPASARAATQRFMSFLEMEAERGQLSRTIEKKVLDVMIAALTDTIGDHPELLQHEAARPDTRMRQEGGPRALLAAYKEELLRGPALRRLGLQDLN